MAAIKFNHVFWLLMVGGVATSLALKPSTADGLRAPVGLLFAPVSEPVSRGSVWINERIEMGKKPGAGVPGARTFDEVDSENATLRNQLVSLMMQLDELKQLNQDREMMGDVRNRAVPARVVGWDSGIKQILHIVAPADTPLAESMPVISARGLVGRLTGGLRGGGRVLLTTDRESKVQCSFVRFVRDPNTGGLVARDLPSPAPLVRGTGRSDQSPLFIQNLSMKNVKEAGIQVGDVAVVNDIDYPVHLRGFIVATITEIRESKSTPLFAEILLDPPTDFRRLKEVMVVNR